MERSEYCANRQQGLELRARPSRSDGCDPCTRGVSASDAARCGRWTLCRARPEAVGERFRPVGTLALLRRAMPLVSEDRTSGE